jgi:hypothetical protein
VSQNSQKILISSWDFDHFVRTMPPKKGGRLSKAARGAIAKKEGISFRDLNKKELSNKMMMIFSIPL